MTDNDNLLQQDILDICNSVSKISFDRNKVLTFFGTKEQIDNYTGTYKGVNTYVTQHIGLSDCNLAFIFLFNLVREVNYQICTSSLNNILIKEKLFHLPFYDKYKYADTVSFYDIKTGIRSTYGDNIPSSRILSPGQYVVCEYYTIDEPDLYCIDINDGSDPGSIHELDNNFNGSVYVEHDIPVYDFSGLYPDD